MALHPDASKQTRWLDLIQRWRRSQLTVREFCQRHHISEASFFSWRRVLRQRGLPADLAMLLDGIDFTSAKRRPRYQRPAASTNAST